MLAERILFFKSNSLQRPRAALFSLNVHAWRRAPVVASYAHTGVPLVFWA